MKQMRLNKYLAAAGIASRRAADAMITEGRIRLNGTVVENLATLVDPRRDSVEVDGKPVSSLEAHAYILMFKPRGVITTASDPRGRRTVLDLLPGGGPRLYPVGRLDMETDGLLLLTNDGKLAFRLTHPKYGVEKTYRVRLDRPIEESDLDAVRVGVMLDDGPTQPARVVRAGDRLEVTIHEGRNRQVRRVFEALGHEVVALRRIRFGILDLNGLERGAWRKLTPGEVHELKKQVGLLNG